MRYARVGDVSLAYQTWGTGLATIVAIPPLAQNIELMWERPQYRRMLDRLGSFAAVLHFDKRGTGASDRTTHVPTMDERVEDLRAVMQAAGIRSAYLLGVSEGGPVALSFAATYPDRVDGVVLVSSGARLVPDETAAEREAGRERRERFISCWGTEASVTLQRFAPSVAADPDYRAWEPRYERQSASPATLRELLEMIDAIDVRPLLGAITVPVLVLHRRGDAVVPIELAREVASGVPGARLVELDGDDHMAQVGDTDVWIDEVEEFVTGSVTTRASDPSRPAPRVDVSTMGGFAVRVDGQAVPSAAWGSRRARQLYKRLAVAIGEPVPREELTAMLWPGETDRVRLGARLSVLLSNVRRVLHGGIVADRDAVRLDLTTSQVDLSEVYDALANGDDERAVAGFRGTVLPEDAYEDWAIAARERLSFAIVGAHRRLASRAASASRTDEVVDHAEAIIGLDPYDERAYESLVLALVEAGRSGDASRAEARYQRRMRELGVRPRRLTAPPPDVGSAAER